MPKGLSATQRTLRLLREQGRICAITEKWNPHVGPHGIRQDLFGFVDILALDPVEGFVGIQCCASDALGHWRKITSNCRVESMAWLRAGGKIELWYWRKQKLVRGGTAMRWRPKIEHVTLLDFEPA